MSSMLDQASSNNSRSDPGAAELPADASTTDVPLEIVLSVEPASVENTASADESVDTVDKTAVVVVAVDSVLLVGGMAAGGARVPLDCPLETLVRPAKAE